MKNHARRVMSKPQGFRPTVKTALDVDLIDAEMELNRHNGMYDDTRHDFIHFNASGHRIIAALLADKVRELERR